MRDQPVRPSRLNDFMFGVCIRDCPHIFVRNVSLQTENELTDCSKEVDATAQPIVYLRVYGHVKKTPFRIASFKQTKDFESTGSALTLKQPQDRDFLSSTHRELIYNHSEIGILEYVKNVHVERHISCRFLYTFPRETA
jgi:hypothetical protein